MAKKLKDYYDDECVQLWTKKLADSSADFNSRGFREFVGKRIVDKEFLDRQDVFAEGFESYLSSEYAENLKVFHQLLGPKLQQTEGMFTEGWWLWPVGRYVERHATEDFEASVNFIYELTMRFTGEFAIRPLMMSKPKKTMKVMMKWSRDKNVHVRRLASEGLRIRLPWAKKMTVVLDHFETYCKILSNLKTAPEKFVQKSVGNNLNDLMKESPRHAHQIINEWSKNKPTPETQWILKHGSRSLKQKN